MSKTKWEKIESIQEEIKQLENQRKRLMQQQKEQDRKDRTRRLCKRAGLMESLLPDTITLSDDLFKTFLEQTLLSENSRKLLVGLNTQHDPASSGQIVPCPVITSDKIGATTGITGAGVTG